MRKIITEDGSITFYNEKYDEKYHTKAGALTESLKKFVEPSDFEHTIKKKEIIYILDVCFGLGYNSLIAIEEIRKINTEVQIIIHALENDIEIIKQIKNIRLDTKESDSFKDIIDKYLKDDKSLIDNKNLNVKVIFHIGDATKTITNIRESFDYIFLDPFSTTKCPELWEYDFLKEIYKRSRKGAILTTYSCARKVRDNLKRCGFEIEDVASFGRRAPSTKAIKNNKIDKITKR
jgi:tRNA U34 5-methylaminomethyl-2-thiouridine-forming methyltransferase MnmC